MIKNLLTIIALAASSISFGQKIAGGASHSLFLCPDGSVKACGYNFAGQLGLGDHIDRRLPESITSLSGVTDVVSGGSYSLFLKNNGTVWGCGYNSTGMFGGEGNGNYPTTPVQIGASVAGFSNIISMAACYGHSLFLKNDGTVWACGDNSSGQLGTGNNSNQIIPVQVGVGVTGFSNIIAIAAAVGHSLFLKNDSTVWACGDNSSGQLGTGNNSNQSIPVQVSSLSGITDIAAGDQYSLFLKKDGTVWGCGTNDYDLGPYVTIYANQPISELNDQYTPIVLSGLSGIKAIDAKGYNPLFLKNDGTVWAYQQKNYIEQHGYYGLTGSPTPIVGLSNITAISTGFNHSLFLKNDNTVWSVGLNYYGELGTGNTTNQTTPVNISIVCTPPAPPTVDMSNFPSSVCLGSSLNTSPSISGSNPVLTMSVNNSIQINNPKAITKNKNSVFVLNDNDAIARFDFNGTMISNYPNISITGILAYAADDSSNVYLFNGDGKIYKCDSTGTLVNTLSPIYASSSASQLVFTKPVNLATYPENLFLIDAQKSSGVLITGINTYDNSFSNSNLYASDSTANSHATSMCIDNFNKGKRALLADPVNSTLRTRILYPDGSGNFNYQEGYLVDPASTAGMAYDFIDSDTTGNMFTVSSKTTAKLGMGKSFRNTDGSVTSYIDTAITSMINPTQPIGIVSTKLGSGFQLWIADRGQSRILRAYPTMYQISPALPAGLKYNSITGEISGTPTSITPAQNYQVILTTPYGSDTTHFTFAVTPSNGLSNAAGTGTSTAQQNDGLTIKYINGNNCEKLIDIADSLGGTSPGNTQVSQTVYPLVSVIANDSLIRRATQINADNKDSLKVNVTFYYTYQDIQLYKQTTGSSLSNDTIAGSMQIAILQMHDLPNGGKQPIVHSPVTANWSNSQHNWVAVLPVSKFSEFYAGDISTLGNFNCSTTGADTLTANDYYVWNYDTLFASGDYIDTLINNTGCDSIAKLHLNINITTGLNQAALASSISIFPNPSNGVFNIRFNNTAIMPAKIKVINIIGTEVLNKTITSSDSIDLSSYQSGIYYLIVENGDATKTWCIVKQN